MSIVRVGSTSNYAAGWDAIFGGRVGRPGKTGRKQARAAAGRAAKRKAAAKPRPVKAAKKVRKQQSARKKR